MNEADVKKLFLIIKFIDELGPVPASPHDTLPAKCIIVDYVIQKRMIDAYEHK